jgi:hypothetical protein
MIKLNEDRAAAVGRSVDAEAWVAGFDTGFAAIAGRFARVEPHRRARAFLLGLLSDVDSRSCWQLAEQAGDTSPHAMQLCPGRRQEPSSHRPAGRRTGPRGPAARRWMEPRECAPVREVGERDGGRAAGVVADDVELLDTLGGQQAQLVSAR